MQKNLSIILKGLITTTSLIGILIFTSRVIPKTKGVFLENLTWIEAEKNLRSDTVVVIPLGAASKEHGPHLPLNTDWLQAEYYKQALAEQAEVVITPTISYSFYPAFMEYPGSISIGAETSANFIIDICKTLSAYGPKRFYIINVGISTKVPIRMAKEKLSELGIIVDSSAWFPIDTKKLSWIENVEGSHAHEVETSVMLFIKPSTVRMDLAIRELPKSHTGFLTRSIKNTKGTYSPSGIWGDPTKATKEKGEQIVRARMKQILLEIEDLRNIPLLQELN